VKIGVSVLLATLVAGACQGEWHQSAAPSPVRAVHVALLHTGKVLLVAGSGNDRDAFLAGHFSTSIWDPATETFTSVATPWDAFCSGHSFLPDGELLVAGGNTAYPGPATNNSNAGSPKTYLFDPGTSRYVAQPDMAQARWYPTVVELGSGNQFTVGGLDAVGVPTTASQTFDATTRTWSPQKAPPSAVSYVPLYPALHLLADGRLFYSGANVFGTGPTRPGIWNVSTNGWQAVPGLTDTDRRDQSMSVLLPPAQDQKVMIMGGGNQDLPVDAVSSTAIVDLKQPNPAYVPGPALDTKKMYVSAVILPDGRVLETGGATGYRMNADSKTVNSAQILDPTTMQWTKAADPTVGRTYHSGALLLPDGRVLTFGGNPRDGSFEMNLEIYSPTYMTKPRPKITTAPSGAAYGASFAVSTDMQIGSAVLIRPSAVTHSSDSDQRSVDLGLTNVTASGATLTVPANPNLTPPGWYMLFVRDASGTPSVAKWIHISATG
jgi:hypothetical protein